MALQCIHHFKFPKQMGKMQFFSILIAYQVHCFAYTAIARTYLSVTFRIHFGSPRGTMFCSQRYINLNLKVIQGEQVQVDNIAHSSF